MLFQTEDINIFVIHDVFFASYVPPKSSFSDEETSAVKSEKLSKIKVAKGNSISGKSWSSTKVFVMQNYTENTNGDVP